MDNKVLDEAVETYLQVECQAINGDDTEYLRCSDRDREIVRAALLAGVKVLLGPVVGYVDPDGYVWAEEAHGNEYFHPHPANLRPVYAPSLGEGDE